jgi:RNA polymerase sigma factor (TIGR02999 family)
MFPQVAPTGILEPHSRLLALEIRREQVMSQDAAGEVTVLLRAVKDGTPGAADRLMSLVYAQLKLIARNRVASAGRIALEPTTLVHEAYLRLFSNGELSWENRHHFFWAAARAMRDILVENARRQSAEKRGGDRQRLTLDNELNLPVDPNDGANEFLTLDAALRRLEVEHPETARLVMLRFFTGLTRDQVCEVTGLKAAAVWRDWAFAKAWLMTELDGARADPPAA